MFLVEKANDVIDNLLSSISTLHAENDCPYLGGMGIDVRSYNIMSQGKHVIGVDKDRVYFDNRVFNTLHDALDDCLLPMIKAIDGINEILYPKLDIGLNVDIYLEIHQTFHPEMILKTWTIEPITQKDKVTLVLKKPIQVDVCDTNEAIRKAFMLPPLTGIEGLCREIKIIPTTVKRAKVR
jgi:hypothetical protein